MTKYKYTIIFPNAKKAAFDNSKLDSSNRGMSLVNANAGGILLKAAIASRRTSIS